MMDRPAFRVMCVTIAFAAGCSSSPSHFYTLNATVAPVAPMVSTAKTSVVVGPVSVPAAVDQPQIVVSTGANQVMFDEFNRWASPLQDNIARVVAENLVAALGTPRVTLFPQTLNVDADIRVAIEVRNFESTPGKTASLDATWTVRRSGDGKAVTGRTSVREPVQDTSYEALAAAHSRALGRLSQDIAEAVKPMERPAP